jgi:hypothetical protein
VFLIENKAQSQASRHVGTATVSQYLAPNEGPIQRAFSFGWLFGRCPSERAREQIPYSFINKNKNNRIANYRIDNSVMKTKAKTEKGRQQDKYKGKGKDSSSGSGRDRHP